MKTENAQLRLGFLDETSYHPLFIITPNPLTCTAVSLVASLTPYREVEIIMQRSCLILLLWIGTVTAFLAPSPAPASWMSPPVVRKIPHGDWQGKGRRSSTMAVVLFGMKNKPENTKEEGQASIFDTFKKSPGTLIVAPFVLIIGLDLLANIAVVTKRSIEVALTGEYTVWNPFQ